MTPTQTPTIQVGAFVHYHGSIARVHGLWQVAAYDGLYTLSNGMWGTLRDARPESVTECGGDCARCAAYNANH